MAQSRSYILYVAARLWLFALTTGPGLNRRVPATYLLLPPHSTSYFPSILPRFAIGTEPAGYIHSCPLLITDRSPFQSSRCRGRKRGQTTTLCSPVVQKKSLSEMLAKLCVISKTHPMLQAASPCKCTRPCIASFSQ